MIENRYKRLQEAIDFFSQSLHVEQLMYYGYEIVHQSLGLDQSALFMIEDSLYDLKKTNGYAVDVFTEAVDSRHQDLATRFGRILTHDFNRYFSNDLLETFSVAMIMPIIVKNELVGFVVSNGTLRGGFDDEDLDFAFSINQLMNKGYENASAFKSLEDKNFELDKRIFNLFFINHSSRLLLSELQMNQLHGLCVDIVRELTASAITSFFVMDDHTHKLVLRGYKNIIDFDQRYEELKLLRHNMPMGRTVFHIEEDADILRTLIDDFSILESLMAEHVIFIVKDRVLGAITISKPVNERKYDKAVLELIVSVANSIYIAMTNAKQFEEIEHQRYQLAQRLDYLMSLNKAIKNINSCQTVEDLCNVAISTLHYGFGVERGAIYIQYEGDLSPVSAIGYSDEGLLPPLNPFLLPLWKQEHIRYTREQVAELIGNTDYDHTDSNCLIVLPLKVDMITHDGSEFVGCMVIDRLAHPLREEDVIVIESLSHAISPVLRHLMQVDAVITKWKPDPIETLRTYIKEAAKTKADHNIDFRVYIKRLSLNPLIDPDLPDEPSVYVGGVLFTLAFEKSLDGYDLFVEGSDYAGTLADLESLYF